MPQFSGFFVAAAIVLLGGTGAAYLEDNMMGDRALQEPVITGAAYVKSQCSYGGGLRTTRHVLRLVYRYYPSKGDSQRGYEATDFRSFETAEDCRKAQEEFEKRRPASQVYFDAASPWKNRFYLEDSRKVPIVLASCLAALLLVLIGVFTGKKGKKK